MRPVQTWQLVLATALLAVILTTPAGAQLQTGSLFGSVATPEGEPLPGAARSRPAMPRGVSVFWASRRASIAWQPTSMATLPSSTPS
jgi:hypothetical protein